MKLKHHVFVAILLAVAAFGSGAFYFVQVTESNFGTLVKIIQGGISIALSYMLVILYFQQKDVQERQLRLESHTLLPDVQSHTKETQFEDDGTIEFCLTNQGQGPAKKLRAVQTIDVPTTPAEFTYKWEPENDGSTSNDGNYLPESTSCVPFHFDTADNYWTDDTSRHLIDEWLRHREHPKEEVRIEVTWTVEYERITGEPGDVFMESSYHIRLSEGDGTLRKQIDSQLQGAKRTAIEGEPLRRIETELRKAGYEFSPT